MRVIERLGTNRHLLGFAPHAIPHSAQPRLRRLTHRRCIRPRWAGWSNDYARRATGISKIVR
jgi:hypothetical protein